MNFPYGTLPAFSDRGIQAAVVHGEHDTVADILTLTHMMEIPGRNAGPDACQCITLCDRRAQEVVLIIPVAEIASAGHIENTTHAAVGSIVLCGTYVVGTIEGDLPALIKLRSPTAGIGPQITLAVHQTLELGSVLVRIGDVGCADQWSHVPPTRSCERISDPLKIVEHQRTVLWAPSFDLETVRTVEIVAEELSFA